MTAIKRIAELDALPDGTVVVGLDPQATVVHKRAGHWIDLCKPSGTTWNVRTYVMARRYGVRAVAESERTTEVGTTETTLSVTDQLRALIDHYQGREDARTRSIQSFLNEDGDLDEGKYTWSEYDQATDDSSHAARDDLGNLLGELAGLLPDQV
ncbi:hypothetical protein [Streptomyces sp. NPDC048623]|uniref:hypothetical protein n=1 Tax=Streptomyces sp. NPDC048623 TaxID=3155761 RepID=UPI003447A790